MRGAFTLLVSVLTLAAPVAGWAQGGFQTELDAYRFGVNTSTYFTSSVYNTVGCRPARVDNGEATLADVLKENAGLDTNDRPVYRMAYYGGLYFGWMSQTLAEYESCQARRFDVVPVGVVARAAASVFSLLFDDLGTGLLGRRAKLVEIFDIDYAFLGSLTEADRVNCETTVRDIINTTHGGVNELLLSDVAQTVCR